MLYSVGTLPFITERSHETAVLDTVLGTEYAAVSTTQSLLWSIDIKLIQRKIICK